MNKSDRQANFGIKYIFADMFTLVVAFGFAYFLSSAHLHKESAFRYALLLPSFCVVFFLFMISFRMYNISTLFYIDRVVKKTTLSLLGTAATIFLSLFVMYNTTYSRLFLMIFILFSLLLLNAEKLVILRERKRLTPKVDVIYVGEKSLYDNFIRYARLSSFDFNVLGYVGSSDDAINDLTHLGELEDFEAILKRTPCQHVIFTQSLTKNRDIEPYLSIANEMGIVSRVILDVYTFGTVKWYVSSLGAYPMITYHSISLDPISLTIKRLVDIIGSLVGITLLSPVMALTALAIKLDSPGPVLFKQVRVGQNGRRFRIYKFRSMYMDAEQRKAELMGKNEMGDSRLFKMKDDPRVTKVGKFIRRTSIDELPQFFNVLIGNMSLVGTRPPTIAEVEQYDRHHYRRISIKPGITGIWQTSGRNNIKDFEKVVSMDIEYIEKWSLTLDLTLLLKTVPVILGKRGAY